MLHKFFDAFQTFIFTYSAAMMIVYTLLACLSFLAVLAYIKAHNEYTLKNVVNSPLSPGISVIAPAYNEGLTIIDNVRALLTLDYPLFEVIIINDGSTDDTLTKLINQFELIEIDFQYNQRINTRPVKKFYKSVNAAYDKLLVIDKVNGKGKADGSNAGINAAEYDYFLCTDVDCILSRDTLSRLIKPFLGEKSPVRKPINTFIKADSGFIHTVGHKRRVIATGAPLRMINSSDVDHGVLTRFKPPVKFLPRFQELEYIRAYLFSKMGWSAINCVPNVSGGLGLFDKEIAIKVGGYDPRSFAEDIDMVTRMSIYMIENNIDYAVRYVPKTLCWTEGPQTLNVFSRQRTRWARGLVQIIKLHKGVLFNVKYKRLGLIIFPNNFLFEFLAPILETLGFIIYVILICIGEINWSNTFILLGFLYAFSFMVTTMAILWDQLVEKQYKTTGEVLGLYITSVLEPVLYHPLIVYFSMRGYLHSLFRKELSWGNMQRKGFSSKKSAA